MHHYVYKIKDYETQEYYFGSRSCECAPENDDYMGSMCTWAKEEGYSPERHVKEIVCQDFSDRSEAIEYEASIIRKHWKDVLNKNYVIPGQNNVFCAYGEKNPMSGSSVQVLWEKKYGKEKAAEMWESAIKNRKLPEGENHPLYKKIPMSDDEVVLMYKKGLSMNKIAMLNGVSKIKIVAILDKYNVKRRNIQEQCKVRDSEVSEKTRKKMSNSRKGKPRKYLYEYWVDKWGEEHAKEKLKEYKLKMSQSLKINENRKKY